MKKLFNLLLIIIIFLIVVVNPVFGGQGYGSGGYGGWYSGGGYSGQDYAGHNYSGNGHNDHYMPGADAVIFGLGAAIKGSAINNRCAHERKPADEHNTHYNPTHPPQCQDDCNDCQNSDHHHSRDSAPGH